MNFINYQIHNSQPELVHTHHPLASLQHIPQNVPQQTVIKWEDLLAMEIFDKYEFNEPDIVFNISHVNAAFDIFQLCEIVKLKSQQPAFLWTKRTNDNVFLFFHDANISNSLSLPPCLPLETCFLLFSLMLEQMDEFNDLDSFTSVPVSAQQLNLYSIVTESFKILQSLAPPEHLILANSPKTRENILATCIRVLANEKSLAISSLKNSVDVLNVFLGQELQIYTKFWFKIENSDKINLKTISYPFYWYPSVIDPAVSPNFPYFLIQIIDLSQYDLFTPGIPNEPLPIWKCFCSLSTLFFYICFSDEFVENLLADDVYQALFERLHTILAKLENETTAKSSEIRYHVLRTLTVLCEKEEPYFLDFMSKMPCSERIAIAVVKEASKIVQLLPIATNTGNAASDTNPHFVSVKEAFRVMELLSYDSNYVTLVTENATLFLLEFLSVPSQQFVGYFQNNNSYQQYIVVLVFRVIANLHCYNPDVSPIEHKGKLVQTIFYHCSTIWHEESTNFVKKKNLSIHQIIANLFYLFQRISFQFSYTMQEHNLWRNFLEMLEEKFGIKFPVIIVQAEFPTNVGNQGGITAEQRRISRISSQSLDSLALTDSNQALLDGNADPADATKSILKGLSVSFGKVSDPTYLKKIIKEHGGNVLEYVSKSVTHVLCAKDAASVQASNSKIQSAASKQIPAVCEQFISDCIQAGRVLPEKEYLIAHHVFNPPRRR